MQGNIEQVEQANLLFDYDVLDTTGDKIGSVDGVWVDEGLDRPQLIAVKTGWLLGKTHVVPLTNAQIDADEHTIQVAYPQDRIKDAPSYDPDHELSTDQEDEVYRFYGLDTAQGLGGTQWDKAGMATMERDEANVAGIGRTEQRQVGAATTQRSETSLGKTGQAEERVTLSEEELQVGKRQVNTGVRVRKVVRTERKEVPVDLRREEIVVERVPVTGAEASSSDAFQEKDIEVTAIREEPVISKESHVTGQVRVGKTSETETRTVGGEVRREEVKVDKDADSSAKIDRDVNSSSKK